MPPQLGQAWILQGNLDAQLQAWASAAKAYERAIEVNPRLAESHYHLALAYQRLGRKSDARREQLIYEQTKKEQAASEEGRRKEIKRFIIVWNDQPPSSERR